MIVAAQTNRDQIIKLRRLKEMNESGQRSLAVIVLFEALDLFDVIDVVLDFVELRERFSRDNIPQIFFQLHGQFNGIQ